MTKWLIACLFPVVALASPDWQNDRVWLCDIATIDYETIYEDPSLRRIEYVYQWQLKSREDAPTERCHWRAGRPDTCEKVSYISKARVLKDIYHGTEFQDTQPYVTHNYLFGILRYDNGITDDEWCSAEELNDLRNS